MSTASPQGMLFDRTDPMPLSSTFLLVLHNSTLAPVTTNQSAVTAYTQPIWSCPLCLPLPSTVYNTSSVEQYVTSGGVPQRVQQQHKPQAGNRSDSEGELTSTLAAHASNKHCTDSKYQPTHSARTQDESAHSDITADCVCGACRPSWEL